MCSGDWGIELRTLRTSSRVYNHLTTKASFVVKVYVGCDGTSSTVAGTCNVDQSTLLVVVKVYVHRTARLAELQLRWLILATLDKLQSW